MTKKETDEYIKSIGGTIHYTLLDWGAVGDKHHPDSDDEIKIKEISINGVAKDAVWFENRVMDYHGKLIRQRKIYK